MKMIAKRIGTALLLAVFILAPGLLFWIINYAFLSHPRMAESSTPVILASESSFRTIEKELAAAGVILADGRFRILGRMMGVASHLKAGEYLFPPSISPYRVLIMVKEGATYKHQVTIPEGATLNHIATLLAAENLTTIEEFLRLAHDSALLASLNIHGPSLEGYLFPDTYFFERGPKSTETMIRIMSDQMQRVLIQTDAINGLPQYGLDRHGVVTLASIVEKETALVQERSLIARVFLNRLAAGMKLQTDPTVIYGLANFSGNLTRQDLESPSPYNTYRIRGLPPGPISSPGQQAITAVMHPAEESFYYFVSKNDGSHYFSSTLSDHNRAVLQYQTKTNPTNLKVRKQ
ncbi:MAG: endolytic transglycosylase MltG [Proteobacteria bacterium]|nr:endolytic transglycosylase MltG [Pseudomonadota bacterium]MBU1685921.1 endolytic transglycosylase MltG [Pseudomonadota bacterium]